MTGHIERRYSPVSTRVQFQDPFRLLRATIRHNQGRISLNHALLRHYSRMLRAAQDVVSPAQPRLKLLTHYSRYASAFFMSKNRSGVCMRSLCPQMSRAILEDKVTAPSSQLGSLIQPCLTLQKCPRLNFGAIPLSLAATTHLPGSYTSSSPPTHRQPRLASILTLQNIVKMMILCK